MPVSKGCAVFTRRLIPLARDGGRLVSSGVPELKRSPEILEQVFDDDLAVFKCFFI